MVLPVNRDADVRYTEIPFFDSYLMAQSTVLTAARTKAASQY